MKYLFVALFLSAPAYACPDLQGIYICPGEGGTYEMQIQQSGNAFRIQTPKNTEYLIADGKLRAIPNHANVSDGKMLVTCSIDQVFYHQAANILENGQSAGITEFVTAYALGFAKEMKQEIRGYLFLGSRHIPIHESISCTRK